jgi:hypothetical protein
MMSLFTDDHTHTPTQWQQISQRVSRWAWHLADFQARLILTVLYVLFVAPVGLVLRLGDDLLGLRPRLQQGSYWQMRTTDERQGRSLRGQG